MMSSGSVEETQSNEHTSSSPYYNMDNTDATKATGSNDSLEEATAGTSGKPITAGDYVERWSQQVFGEKHPEVKARAQETHRSAKDLWAKGMEKIKQLDEKHQISKKTSDMISTTDRSLKAFDEKHSISEKTNKQVGKISSAYSKTVEKVKAYDEQKQISSKVKGRASHAFQSAAQRLSPEEQNSAPGRRDQ